MRQGGEFFEVNGQRRRRSRYRCTQWTVHAGRGFEFPVIPSHVDHFHAATRRTDHLHAARLDDCGGNRRTQKQREPHQHQFGDEFGAAQGMHVAIMTKVDLSPVKSANRVGVPAFGKCDDRPLLAGWVISEPGALALKDLAMHLNLSRCVEAHLGA